MGIMQHLITEVSSEKGDNESSALKWAAIAAFLVLMGDFIAFILAISALQGGSKGN